MVGYSTIIDYVSIALIKVAKRKNFECNINVVEIPDMFFSEEIFLDREKLELPLINKMLKLGIDVTKL